MVSLPHLIQGMIRFYGAHAAYKKNHASKVCAQASTPKKAPESQDILKRDLSERVAKNAQHRALPEKKERVMMGKISFLGLFILFLMVGGLFIGGGFLLCYTLFPPTSSYTSSHQHTGSYDHNSQNMAMRPQERYASRQRRLKAYEDPDFYLKEAEEKITSAAKKEARQDITRSLHQISHRIRASLGRFLGSIVVPATTGMAQSAVDHLLPDEKKAQKASALPPQKKTSTTHESSSLKGSGKGVIGLKMLEAQHQKHAHTNPTSHGQKTDTQGFSEASEKDLYALHIGTFEDLNEARDMHQEMLAKGFSSYVQKTHRGTFSVLVGPFSKFQEGQKTADILNAQWQVYARIVSLT